MTSTSTKYMRRVIVESPYSGPDQTITDINVCYARACVRDCIVRGESPIASHLLLTQPGILDDTKPIERMLGIDVGHSWIGVAHCLAVYTDRGISNGMKLGIKRADEDGLPIEYRSLYNRYKSKEERTMTPLAKWISTHFGTNPVPPPSPIMPTVAPKVPDHPRISNVALVSPEEIVAGNAAVRAILDESGYGSFVSHEQSTALATAVLIGAAKIRHPVD